MSINFQESVQNRTETFGLYTKTGGLNQGLQDFTISAGASIWSVSCCRLGHTPWCLSQFSGTNSLPKQQKSFPLTPYILPSYNTGYSVHSLLGIFLLWTATPPFSNRRIPSLKAGKITWPNSFLSPTGPHLRDHPSWECPPRCL